MNENVEAHVDNLVRHIQLVRDACVLLGKHYIRNGQYDFGRILISHGHEHDASKFSGIEWQYLHAGRKVPNDKLLLAVHQHVHTNQHHPEFWGDINQMPDIYIAEMVCDWYARSQEGATDLRGWIDKNALQKYKIPVDGKIHTKIKEYVEILAPNPFQKIDNHATDPEKGPEIVES